MRLAQFFLLTLARAQIGGETDHAGFLAVLVEQDRGRDQHRNASPVFGLEHALIARSRAPALAHLDQNVLRPFLAVVKLDGRTANNLLGAIAEQSLGAFVEEDDDPVLVSGDDGVR